VGFESAHEMTPKDEVIGKIYFVQVEDWGPIKIGWTEDLKRRMGELKHNSPFRMRLLACLEEKKLKEDELHKKFSAARIVGKREWFWPIQDLVDYIAALSQSPRSA
jgi:T5orf172 domain